MIAPDDGCETPSVAAQRLGICRVALWRMLDECCARNPARPLMVHMRQAEALYRQQLRCEFPSGYARAHSRSPFDMRDRLRAAGILTEPGRATRIPTRVFDEVYACASGPWCDAWRRAFAAKGRPCAPWILALALHDLTAAPDGGERGPAAWCREALAANVFAFVQAVLEAPALAPPARCGATPPRIESRAA